MPEEDGSLSTMLDNTRDTDPHLARKLESAVIKQASLSWFHWLIIGISFILTIFAWYIAQKQAVDKLYLQLDKESLKVVSAIDEKLQNYQKVLWNSVATIQALGGNVNKEQWFAYASHLKLHELYPEVIGIGIVQHVDRNNLGKYLQEHNNASDFKFMNNEEGNNFFPFSHFYPPKEKKKFQGLDLAREFNQQKTIMRTIDSRNVLLSLPLKIIQPNENGFFIMAPYFNKKNLSNKKMKGIRGLVVIPVMARSFVEGLLEKEQRLVRISLKDDEQLLYSEIPNKDLETSDSVFEETNLVPRHKIPIMGRIWEVKLSPKPKFYYSYKSSRPIIILFSGVLIELFLIYIFLSISKKAETAVSYAKSVKSELREKERRLLSLTMHDSLTLLMNRKGFFNYLPKAIKRAAKNEHYLAVLYIDLDDFKVINDGFGHTFGDDLLIAIANKLLENFEESTFIARVGSDEFAVILEDILDEDTIAQVAKKIIRAFSNHRFNIHGINCKLSMSIGIAVFPHAGTSAERLVQRADIALHRAKKAGKNRFAFYSSDLDRRLQRKHKIEMGLNRALTFKEFELMYQPQINLDTREIIGLEVLIRWRNKKLENPSPDEFIKIAETTGLIIPIGQWILEQAVEDYLEIFYKTGIEIQDLSVNISAVQLADGRLKEICYNLLKENELLKDRLLLEVTETSLLNNFDKARTVLYYLNKIGVRFAIDDFGTGYSSLSYLKHLPFSVLKIDQSFVRDIGSIDSDMSIIQAIISLSKRLNLHTIAEGIETREQYEYLQLHGCEFGQGYYMSRPLPLDQAIEFIKNWKP